MPTESSVVASLIRDATTHRLPSEPAFVDLFGQREPSAPTRGRPAKASPSPQTSAQKPAATKARPSRPRAPTSEWKGWLQFALGAVLIGAWAYAASQLEQYASESSSPTPQAAAVMPTAPAPVQPTLTPIESATVTPIESPTVTPIEQQAKAPVATPSTEPAAPIPAAEEKPVQVSKKKRRAHAKRAKAKPAVKDAIKASSDTSSAEAAPPKPVAEVPKATAPRRPLQQSDDSENPLE